MIRGVLSPGVMIFLLVGVAFRKAKGNSPEDFSEVLNEEYFSEDLHEDQRAIDKVKQNTIELKETLAIHNKLRAKEDSSDMQSLRWNTILENMAKVWADRCVWKHGQAKSIPSELGYKFLGQNLYAITGTTAINITGNVLSWYNEKPFYNYNTNYCASNKQCGHYTQVVWAETYEIGCAYTRCSTLHNSPFKNALFYVCNYGPGGNIIGQRPFQKGPGCSNCSTGQFWCTQGLCSKSCSLNPGPNCGCPAKCRNGGKLVSSKCSCKCSPGWTDFDCSKKCKNYDGRCNPAPGHSGWPPPWCNHLEYGHTIRRSCPLMCGQCTS